MATWNDNASALIFSHIRGAIGRLRLDLSPLRNSIHLLSLKQCRYLQSDLIIFQVLHFSSYTNFVVGYFLVLQIGLQRPLLV